MRSDGVFHFGRYLEIDFPMDESVLFQFSQLLRQHFLSQTRHESSQFAKTTEFFFKIPEDQNLPASADYVERDFYGADLLLLIPGHKLNSQYLFMYYCTL